MISKIERRNKIKTRIRGRISGTAQRPRMTVFRSNKQIYVQLIDDMAGTTLASASSRGLELKANKTEIAAAVAPANPLPIIIQSYICRLLLFFFFLFLL